MNTETPSKDTYDTFLSFSRITPENWLAPDRKDYMPFGIGRDDWIKYFLEPRLDVATVPQKVIQVFEIARGALIYSWFFYPLATLGMEQCARVAEFAIRERCLAISQEQGIFFENIRTLAVAGIISAEDESRWQAVRNLRNNSSHPERLTFTDPGQALTLVHSMVELINRIFNGSAKPSS
jgi:hypothetical protein